MPYYQFSGYERDATNRIGAKDGCHSCGTKDPGTVSGNWIADPQPPSAVNWGEKHQEFYPHCLRCKKLQGLALRDVVFRNGRRAPWTGADIFGCVVFITDSRSRDTPREEDFDGTIWRVENCLAVGCVSYMDSGVEVRFEKPDRADSSILSVFAATIATPSRWVAAFSAKHDMICGVPVPGLATFVEVWTNHLTEPDKLFVSASSNA